MLRTCYLITFVFTLIVAQAYSQISFRKYSNPKLKFSFDLPAQWRIKYSKEEEGFICIPSTAIEKREYEDCFEGIIFRLEFFHTGLDSTLRSGNYKKRGNYYYTTDRVNDSVKVKNIKGKNWVGVYHNNVCGISCKETGFHAAAGQCQFIYFSNSRSTILIETNGRELDDHILKRIVMSFSFN